MKIARCFFIIALLSMSVFGQGSLTPAKLLQPSADSWPIYNGDYSGRRYSTLSKINANNISSLSLAWIFRAVPGGNLNATIKSTPLVVNGVMYFTIPDHVWALDARTGRQIWHYTWQSQGGDHIGNRGVGILGEWLFFETPDCHFVSLDLKEGKERWGQGICGPNHRQKSPDRRCQWRRSRHPRIFASAFTGNRRAAVAVERGTKARRTRFRNVAQRGSHGSWRGRREGKTSRL